MTDEIKLGRGAFLISPELLIEALKLPKGTVINHVCFHPWERDFKIVIESSELPSIAHGAQVPVYNPLVTANDDWSEFTWDFGEPI